MIKKKSKSRQIAEKTIFATFQVLKEFGALTGKEVIEQIRLRLQFDDYEKHVFEKTGYVRWESVLHFYTINCMKAGLMVKENKLWNLTEEGEAAIKLGPEKLFDLAQQRYKQWSASTDTGKAKTEEEESEEVLLSRQSILQQFEEKAFDGIREFIMGKSPYEFQDLVSYLLVAMGYFISHIAEKGPDGGIDIIAYTDPLGTKEPRLIVQVKHRPEAKVPSDDIQKLVGTMKRSSDVGIFVTSGQFSSVAIKEARTSHKHIELIDYARFIVLWQEHYHKMNDEQRNALPLKAIHFLGE